jgi:hypothetical protein
MEAQIEDIICEAKCCAGNIAHKYIREATFGNDNKALLFDMMRLNAYVRTLERNIPKITIKKEKVVVLPNQVPFNSLNKNKNVLYLNPKAEVKVVCTKVKSTPCLTDSEVQKIIEEIRLLCSTCNCNCK